MKALAISQFRGWARMETVQVYYSIAGRDIEREFKSLAEEEGVGLLAWSPLAGGLLSGRRQAVPSVASAAQRMVPLIGDLPPQPVL